MFGAFKHFSFLGVIFDPEMENTGPVTPADALVKEDGSTFLVDENGTTFLIQEGSLVPGFLYGIGTQFDNLPGGPQILPSPPFRDFSTLAAFGGNPITPHNTAPWNSGGTDAPGVSATTFAGLLLGLTENNSGVFSTFADWDGIAIYTAPIATPLSWTAPGGPCIVPSAGQWDDNYLTHPRMIRLQSGVWAIYYSAFDPSHTVCSIGMATNPNADPRTGVWTKYAGNPIITGSNRGVPCVLDDGGTIYLYTSDGGVAGTTITYYTSPSSDGFTFTAGGVALPLSTADWDYPGKNGIFDGIFDPSVSKTVLSDGTILYEMIYTSSIFDGVDAHAQRLSYAVARTPTSFFKYQSGPILTLADGFPGDGVMYLTGGSVYLYAAVVVLSGAIPLYSEGRAYTI